ncbi:MAG: HpcH/HpaI aldolase/citrate lyase family protein [Spirochaetota bacterium]
MDENRAESKNRYTPLRSALFVPGNRPDRIDRAVKTSADTVIIDLEDAVPVDQKQEARAAAGSKIQEHLHRRLLVRINALETGLAADDLEHVVAPGLEGVVLPKVESPVQLRQIHLLLKNAEIKEGLREESISVIPLIESALGIEKIFRILEASPASRILTAAFGAADYALDMGTTLTTLPRQLCYPRAKIATSCAAAGLCPPLDTPFMIDLKDLEAVEKDAAEAKSLGFGGKLCIHPCQVDVVNRVFSPGSDEIEHARRVVQAFEEAQARGAGAVQVDGKFIDYPVVERCRRILQLSRHLQGDT